MSQGDFVGWGDVGSGDSDHDLSERLASQIPVGRQLCGRYQIITHIADGAVASVYQARDLQTNVVVALKVLDPLRGADAVGRARFEREFQLLSQLSHPGIARCLGLERDGDLDILVLEYVEGMTLADALQSGRYARIDAALHVALGLAEALQACHDAGIIHRDLKPANVMIHPTRGAVILDFGVAWFSAAASLTRTGAVIGSPQYMAPEVFASSYVDARADVYAIGAMLFEMLTGRAMRLGNNVTDLAMRTGEVPPAVSTLRPDVPPVLDAIVSRAGAPRPDDRYATARELAQALRAGTPGAPRGLKARTTCKKCRTRQVVDLPFCAGCGKKVTWGLHPGAYAVQLLEVPDVEQCARWLEERHLLTLQRTPGALRLRLRHAPVPVAVGIAEDTAEQLVAEAQDIGCRAEIVRARSILGTRIQSGAATSQEVWVALALHFTIVMVLGVIAGLAVGIPVPFGWTLFFLPSFVAAVGVIYAAFYVRRPLLVCPKDDAVEASRWDEALKPVIEALSRIRTERARSLAANAVLRATPAITGARASAMGPAEREAVWRALLDALAASSEVDAHAEYLQGRSRGRLSAEIEATRVRIERGDEDARVRIVVLEQEKEELLEAAIAHDLSARRALEDAQQISALVARR